MKSHKDTDLSSKVQMLNGFVKKNQGSGFVHHLKYPKFLFLKKEFGFSKVFQN